MRVPLNLTNIDFDSLKGSLKSYMQGNPEFSDINFEGSNINVIMDLLAVNGQLQLFYEHMGLNESFLTSALLKSSVISKAKELGYTPRSSKAAKAVVNVSMQGITNNPAGIVIPRGTRFTGSGTDGNSYTFVNTDSGTLLKNVTTGHYEINNLEISEGKLYTVEYEYDGIIKTFRIPNIGCDTSTMIVTVKTSAGTNYYVDFHKADSILNLNSTSTAYYLQQSGKGEYEIYFGDGTVSAGLSVGNIIIINYLVTNDSVANNITSFDISTALYAQLDPIINVVSTVLTSSGGTIYEDIESIRDNAKKTYVTQYRSVIETDYEQNILMDFPEVKSVTVWGGENNVPKMFGRVFCSVVTTNLLPVSQNTKDRIISAIKKRNIINISPVIVDPNVITIAMTGYIRVNRFMSTLPPETITSGALTKISMYNSESLRKFGGIFQYSELSRIISNIDQSISGVVINFECQQPLNLISGVNSDYTIKFYTEIRPNEITSSGFNIVGVSDVAKLVDKDGLLYNEFTSGTKKYLSASSIGTINYTTGEIIIKSFKVTPVDGSSRIVISVKPSKTEVYPQFNQILNIDINKTNISVVSN
jgi:hypothetical protein